MNGADDRLSSPGQSLEHLDDAEGHEGIQTGRRFVAEHERRVCEHFRCEIETLPFSAGNAPQSARNSDPGVLAFR